MAQHFQFPQLPVDPPAWAQKWTPMADVDMTAVEPGYYVLHVERTGPAEYRVASMEKIEPEVWLWRNRVLIRQPYGDSWDVIAVGATGAMHEEEWSELPEDAARLVPQDGEPLRATPPT